MSDSIEERMIKMFNILISKPINGNKLSELIDDSMIELLKKILQMFEQMNALGDNEKIKLVTSIESKLPPIGDKLIANSLSAIIAYLGSMNISDSLKLKYTRAFVLAMIKLNYNIIYLKMNPKEAYEKAQNDSGIKDKTTFDTLFYVAQPFMISVDAAILGIVTATSPIWVGLGVAYKKFTPDSINDPNVTKEEQKKIEQIEKLQKDNEEHYIDFPVALAVNDMYELFTKETHEYNRQINDQKEREIAISKEAKREFDLQTELIEKIKEDNKNKQKQMIELERNVYTNMKSMFDLNYNFFILNITSNNLQHFGINSYAANIIILSILNQMPTNINLKNSSDRISNMIDDVDTFGHTIEAIIIGPRPIDIKSILSTTSNIIPTDYNHIIPDMPKPTPKSWSLFRSKSQPTAEPKTEPNAEPKREPNAESKAESKAESNSKLLVKPSKKKSSLSSIPGALPNQNTTRQGTAFG